MKEYLVTEADIRDELLQFNWSNWGLDEVDEAEIDWADDLAENIFERIFGK